MFIDLHELSEGTVIRRLHVLGETTRRQLLHPEMILDTFATYALLITRIGAVTPGHISGLIGTFSHKYFILSFNRD